jgi:hypothetical protein
MLVSSMTPVWRIGRDNDSRKAGLLPRLGDLAQIPMAGRAADMNEEDCMNSGYRGTAEIARDVSRRRFAKALVVALAVAGFAAAGLSGALAKHGDWSDDDTFFAPSGGFMASGGSGGSGWDDDWVFPGSGASGGSGGSGWDDDWDDD